MKISPHAWPFAAVALTAATALGAFVHWAASLPALLFLVFTLWFFRDPERDIPQGEGLLVSPADGTIIRARPDKISIFMNVFNVHVCRAPAAGTVRSVVHHPGRFLAAWKDEAPEQNERVVVDLDVEDGSLRFTLVAGLVARRILCSLEPGQVLERGERIGLIRFGSRVDVDLPDGWVPGVQLKQRTTSGETPIATKTQPRAARAG
jgi:phosphatidylserine decarboxylase